MWLFEIKEKWIEVFLEISGVDYLKVICFVSLVKELFIYIINYLDGGLQVFFVVGYLLYNGFQWVGIFCQLFEYFGIDINVVGFKKLWVVFVQINDKFFFIVFQFIDDLDGNGGEGCQVF